MQSFIFKFATVAVRSFMDLEKNGNEVKQKHALKKNSLKG